MKFNCPSCQCSINNIEIKVRRRVGMTTEKQCPKCNIWLRLDPNMEKLKIIGLITLLVSSVLNIALIFPEFQIELASAGAIGASLALFSALRGKMKTA